MVWNGLFLGIVRMDRGGGKAEKALTGQAPGALDGILVGNGLFLGDRYRGGGWVVGGWAKSGESFALTGANAGELHLADE